MLSRLFQSTTATKLDSEYMQDYTSYSPHAKLKYYKLKSIELKFFHPFMSISDDFWLNVPKIAKKDT